MLLRFNVWSKVTGEWLDPEDYVVDGCYGNLLEVKGSIIVGNKFEHPFWFAEDFGRPAKRG